MPDLPLTGGCLCGGVRFEITEEPESAGYCHCTRCQRRTGTAASAQAKVRPGSVRITSGEDLVRTYAPEEGFTKSFCSCCGSALFSSAPDDEDIFSVRLGALDPGHGLRPEYRQRLESAADWEPIPDDGLKRYEGSRWT
jgi:hypothetical protein